MRIPLHYSRAARALRPGGWAGGLLATSAQALSRLAIRTGTAMWHACAINGMIASYIGVEVSSEVSVPLAQKQSFQSPSMRPPTREAIGVVCLRSFGVDDTVAWVLSTRGCVQRISQGENMKP